MIQRIRTSWALVRASARLIRRHEDLLIFPILSALTLAFTVATMMLALLAANDFDLRQVQESQYLHSVVALFVFYFVQHFIVYFTNTALVGATLLYLDGETPTVGHGLTIAYRHLWAIIGYALIMASIAMVFRWLFRRGGAATWLAGPFARRIAVFSLIGIAWELITFLVIPILIVEEMGPLQAIRRSSHLIKTTWGERVVGYASSFLMFLLASLPILAVGMPGIARAIASANELWITLAIYGVVMSITVLFMIKLSFDGVFSAILYRYAAGQPVPAYFDEALLRTAFRPRASWLRFRRRQAGEDEPCLLNKPG
jgi:hypothetical protein